MLRFLLFALLCGPLFALDERQPQIVCRDARGKSFPLNLERFEMQVAILEDLAETTLTLTFRNDTTRQLEGDFLLPLPPEANISGYALEVNGAFREAVAVEKERAKLAYETIKRRGIDPGIVEKEADNLYRTRIFPIEPKSNKSVRISYLEYLPINGPEPYRPTYRYPFNFTSEVGEISIRIENPNEALIHHPDLEFLKDERDSVTATLKNKTLAGELTIESKDPHQSRLILSKRNKGQSVGYLTLNRQSFHSDDAPLTPRFNTPKKLKLFWDASRSMEGTDFTKVNAYLEALFNQCPQVTVQLTLLRNTAHEAGSFQIKEGDWSLLKKTLEAISYDGASDFNSLDGIHHDFALLVTDGRVTRWPDNVTTLVPTQPVVALLTGAHRNVLLNDLTTRSGGRTLSLESLTTEEAIAQSFQKSFHISSTQRGLTITPLPSNAPHVHRYLLEGSHISKRQLQVVFGKSKLHSLVVEDKSTSLEFLERLSAIATLSRLQDQGASPVEIIAHCKEHTLASDHTSLIVLERFEDHLTFRIPPPEPHLLTRYHEELSRKKALVQQALTQSWAQVLTRHRHNFPGREFLLLEDLRRIQTFNEAQEQVFTPKDLDPAVSEALTNWVAEATQLLRKQENAQDKKEWLQEATALGKKATQLAQLSPAPQDTIAISIRGFIKSPGIYRHPHPITLKEAAEKAGPFEQENLSRVALYRSATKTVYNTLSKQYQDLPLLPGDMIVVEERPSPWGSADPFFGGDVPSPENEPAVISRPAKEAISPQPPVFLSDLSQSNLTDFGARRSSASARQKKTQASLMNPIPIALHAINLHKEGKNQEANQHLSNLRELFPNNPAALRVEAFVYSTWKETAAAERIYRQLLALDPGDSLSTSLLAHLLITENRRTEARECYQIFLDGLAQRRSFSAANILLNDRNALLDFSSGQARQERLPKDLRIVIANLHPDPSFEISFTDPFDVTSKTQGTSPTGVNLTSSIGLSEITDREASQGTYKLAARCNRDQLLKITIYRDFAKKSEKITTRVLKLPASKRGEFILLELIEVK